MIILTTHSFDNIRYILIILLGFSIPLSTAATNIIVGLVIMLLLVELLFISNDYQQKWLILRHHTLVWLAMALFGFMLIATVYTTVTWVEIGNMLLKYRELLFIPLLILLMRDEKSKKFGFYAFLLSMGLTLFLSYLIVFTGWHIGKGSSENPFVFKNHITQGILMSLAAYFLAVQSFQQQRWRWTYLTIVALAVYNIIFMTQGRTGYLVLVCLILLLIYQIYHWRGFIMGIIVLSVISTIIYANSEHVKTRINKIFENVAAYEQGHTGTSIGLRVEFYKNSLQLIVKHPFFGTGTGSFHQTYTEIAELQGMVTTGNPHNEYFMIAVQWGLVGLSLFIALLLWSWLQANRLVIEKKWMTQGLVMTMVVGCLVNSLLLDFTEGHLFVFLLSIFLAGLNDSDNFVKITTDNTVLNSVICDSL